MKKIIQFLFGKQDKSRPNARCPYCRKSIKNPYYPNNNREKEELFYWTDIDAVYICKKCGGMRHALCVVKNRRKMGVMRVNIFEVMDEASKGDDSFLAGYECPKCGSMERKEAYASNDGSPIILKNGKRI